MTLRYSNDAALIEELEARGYVVYYEESNPVEDIRADARKLKMDHDLIGGAFFQNQLKLFFTKYAS